jgi:hypothetical protein
MSPLNSSSFGSITKEVFWRPAVGFIAAVSALSTFWSSLRYTLLADMHFNWKVLQWVLSWHWQTWVAFWSVVWIGIIFKGTVDAIHRREILIATANERSLKLEERLQQATSSLESAAEKIQQHEAALSELRSSCEQLQLVSKELRTQLDKAAGLSLSLKAGENRRRVWMTVHGPSESQPIHALISDLTLLIYNHGEKPVRLHGCKIWKLHATEKTQELLIETLSTPQAPTAIDVMDPILRLISGSDRPYFNGLPGKCTVRITVKYFRHAEASEDEKSQDFEIVCVQQGGPTVLRIEVTEVSATQS